MDGRPLYCFIGQIFILSSSLKTSDTYFFSQEQPLVHTPWSTGFLDIPTDSTCPVRYPQM